jgi:signal transduction histidine kinase
VVNVDPGRVRSNAVVPRPVIQSVLADGHDVLATPAIALPADTRRIEIQYGAVALLQPDRVRHRYRLEGADATWVQAGALRTARYASLPAGSYRFRLQASNNDGLWDEGEAVFPFTVAAPFHRQLWFYLLCASGLLPVALLVHRGRVMRLRAQYLATFTERARVARELHDTLLQGLTAISMQLGALRGRLSSGPPGPPQELAQIQDAVSRCLQETRQAVRGLREQERTDHLGPALARLGQRLRGTSAVAFDLAVQGTPARLSHAVADQLYRIGQEAITNAFKHAQASKIEVRLVYQPGAVALTVADDGRGFDADRPSADAGEHFGLVGLRERVQQIAASLSIRAGAGGGTIVEVVVPYAPDQERSPGG